MSVIRKLYQEHDVDIHASTNEGRTPALEAVRHGHATTVAALSAFGVDMNARLHKKPRINLFNEAVTKGDLTVMAALVECGVDVHARCDKAGDTVAHTAATNGQHHVFIELQRLGMSLESSDWAGQSPAFIAAGKGDVECLRALRECGVDLLQCGTNDLSPLQAAKSKNNLDVVQYLEELFESTDTSAKQAENALLATLDAEERAKSNKVARNTSKKKKKDRKRSATSNASGTTSELAIASTEDEAVNLEPTFYGSKTPPHQVTCCGLAVEDHLSSSGDKGAAGERAARERAAGTKRAARERAATAARAAGISIPSGVVVAHARPLRRKQRGVDEDALEEAISRGAMPRELPTVNPRLNVKSIKQGNEFYLRSAQDSVVHITVVRHGVNTGQDVKIVETRAYSRLELQREIFELERHVDELLRPTVRSFTSPDLALK